MYIYIEMIYYDVLESMGLFSDYWDELIKSIGDMILLVLDMFDWFLYLIPTHNMHLYIYEYHILHYIHIFDHLPILVVNIYETPSSFPLTIPLYPH